MRQAGVSSIRAVGAGNSPSRLVCSQSVIGRVLAVGKTRLDTGVDFFRRSAVYPPLVRRPSYPGLYGGPPVRRLAAPNVPAFATECSSDRIERPFVFTDRVPRPSSLVAIVVLSLGLPTLFGFVGTTRVAAQDPLASSPKPPDRQYDDLLDRLRRLETAVYDVPVAADDLLPADGSEVGEPSHYVRYDGGWILRPHDPQRTPFELKFELHNQFRYTRFEHSGGPWVDAAGNRRLISDRNDFDINRGRLVFSGFAFDPKLTFYANIDYSTVAANSIQPLLAWMAYEVDEDLRLYCGLGKVPGTWEWQQTSRYTLGADRTLATTFFRPSISAGVWANATLTDEVFVTAFVGDGFNTLTLRADELDTRLVYSVLSWYEPLGEFGVGFSDLEDHRTAAVRVGHAITTTRNESAPNLDPGAEGTVVRLSDGTRVVEPGALIPGERINEFDIWLYAVHAGWKYRGHSLSGETFFRWLRNLTGTGGSRAGSIFDHGYFLQAATFAVPKSLEFFARGSQVFGDHGSGGEVAVGANWYPYRQRGCRLTCDLTEVDSSPAQQSRTGYIAGGEGILFRVQLWTFF